MAEAVFQKVHQEGGHANGVRQRKAILQDNRNAMRAGKLADERTTQLAQKPNNTGLPDKLKHGIESLSGMSMDNVKVHYNSSKPTQLNAHAYAQGTDIHVAPGQEKHLPHEAWHVVQQAQGRVRPTMQMKRGVPVNDDKGLENEADVMGAKAVSVGVVQGKTMASAPINQIDYMQVTSNGTQPIQMVNDWVHHVLVGGGAAVAGAAVVGTAPIWGGVVGGLAALVGAYGLYRNHQRGAAAPVPGAPVPGAPVPGAAPPVPVHTIASNQMNSARARIAQLVAFYAADRVTLTAMIAGGNIVYRNQQGAKLVALNNRLIAGTARAAVLNGRGAALVPAVTTQAGYDVLLQNIGQEFATHKAFRRALTAQRALPLNPTIGVGVGALAGAGAKALVAAIARWNGGGGGVIAGSVFSLPPFSAHAVDPRWEVRVPAIPGWVGADPFAHPNNVLGNGSIPITAHGARNVPAARGALIAAMNAAGYV